jgi:hypothetical protein
LSSERRVQVRWTWRSRQAWRNLSSGRGHGGTTRDQNTAQSRGNKEKEMRRLCKGSGEHREISEENERFRTENGDDRERERNMK